MNERWTEVILRIALTKCQDRGAERLFRRTNRRTLKKHVRAMHR